MDLARVASAITPKTRWIVVSTPHNPSGRSGTWRNGKPLAELILPPPHRLDR